MAEIDHGSKQAHDRSGWGKPILQQMLAGVLTTLSLSLLAWLSSVLPQAAGLFHLLLRLVWR
jgi:hypothetical protein